MPYKDKKAQMEYQRVWCANRRKEYVDKHGGKCVKCSSTHRLEFDHINPEEKVSHRIWSWSRDRIEAELAKCQLLCRDCHLSKTFNDNYATAFNPAELAELADAVALGATASNGVGVQVSYSAP